MSGPFTGTLPMTWPRTEAQVPINVGDADYDPLFPFGWGLRTDSARDRIAAAVTAIGAANGHPAVRPALQALDHALARTERTGNATRSAALLRPLGAALAALDRAPADTTATQEAIVSVARDLAQARVTAGTADADWARLIANADHALLTGNAETAFTLLTQVIA